MAHSFPLLSCRCEMPVAKLTGIVALPDASLRQIRSRVPSHLRLLAKSLHVRPNFRAPYNRTTCEEHKAVNTQPAPIFWSIRVGHGSSEIQIFHSSGKFNSGTALKSTHTCHKSYGPSTHSLGTPLRMCYERTRQLLRSTLRGLSLRSVTPANRPSEAGWQ